jgi:hypothetical protein
LVDEKSSVQSRLFNAIGGQTLLSPRAMPSANHMSVNLTLMCIGNGDRSAELADDDRDHCGD